MRQGDGFYEKSPLLTSGSDSSRVPEEAESGGSSSLCCKCSKESRLVINLVMCAYFSSVCFSMLGSFFYRDSVAKGLGPIASGLIVGEFSLISLIVCPLLWSKLSVVGVKFLYTAGISVTGCSTILFGLLIYCPPGPMFGAMCAVTRAISAVGNSMFYVASFAIIINEFEYKMTNTILLFQLFVGLGLVTGPCFSGLLYALDGFRLACVAVGFKLLISACFTPWILPSVIVMRDSNFQGLAQNMASAITPFTLILLVIFGVSTSFIGMSVTVFQSYFFTFFDMTPLFVGFVFLLMGTFFGLSRFVTRKVIGFGLKGWFLMLAASICLGIASLFLGPSPLVRLEPTLYGALAAVSVIGICMGVMWVSTRVLLSTFCEDERVVYVLMSLALHLGLFLGSTLSGVVLQFSDAEWLFTGYSIIAFVSVIPLIVVLIIRIARPLPESYRVINEEVQ